jgi:hypothetical protein
MLSGPGNNSPARGTPMKRDNDNVVDFATRQSKVSRQQSTRSPEQDAHRLKEANHLLHKLRNTKRLLKPDQSAIVGNLGRLIVGFGFADRKEIALSVMEKNEHDKRKRYIRFPNESVGPQARYAASGGSFARIVEGLIQWQAGKSVNAGEIMHRLAGEKMHQ